MNQIIIVLLLFVLMGSKNDSIKNILANISIEDALPLLQMLGISESSLQTITAILPNLSTGNFDIQTLIKTIIPLIASITENPTKSDSPRDENFDNISEFAPCEIIDGMRDYFA